MKSHEITMKSHEILPRDPGDSRRFTRSHLAFLLGIGPALEQPCYQAQVSQRVLRQRQVREFGQAAWGPLGRGWVEAWGMEMGMVI